MQISNGEHRDEFFSRRNKCVYVCFLDFFLIYGNLGLHVQQYQAIFEPDVPLNLKQERARIVEGRRSMLQFPCLNKLQFVFRIKKEEFKTVKTIF